MLPCDQALAAATHLLAVEAAELDLLVVVLAGIDGDEVLESLEEMLWLLGD